MTISQWLNKILNDKFLIFILLIGVSFPLLAADKHIDLKIYNNGSTDKIEFTNDECPVDPHPGCIEVTVADSSPNISWKLDDADNQNWELTRLQFSPDGLNWGDPGYPLKDCTMENFDLSEDDRDTGHASSAQVLAHGKRIQIQDRHHRTGVDCDTHYKLFAQPRAGGDEINSDPVIRDRN